MLLLATEQRLFGVETSGQSLTLAALTGPAPSGIRMLKVLSDGDILVAAEDGLYRIEEQRFRRLKLALQNPIELLQLHPRGITSCKFRIMFTGKYRYILQT